VTQNIAVRIYVTPQQKKRMDEARRETGVPVAAQIRMAIEEFVPEVRKPRRRSRRK
jgi:hypothetical protein